MTMKIKIQPAPGRRRVPFPGGEQHLTGPRRMTITPYWERYLELGVVMPCPEVAAPVSVPAPMPIATEE